MSIMDQVKKNLREWYSLAADRTGEMAKISVRMYDKYGISREIERQLSELGSYIYHAVEEGRTDFAGDQEFQAWIDRVRSLESDLAAKEEEIDDIRVARQQKQASRERSEEEGAEAGEPLRAEEAQDGAPAEEAPERSAAEAAGSAEPAAEVPSEDSDKDR